jgi:hypothetical protein
MKISAARPGPNADRQVESHTETRTPPEGGAVVVAMVAGVYLKLAVPLDRTSP